MKWCVIFFIRFIVVVVIIVDYQIILRFVFDKFNGLDLWEKEFY